MHNLEDQLSLIESNIRHSVESAVETIEGLYLNGLILARWLLGYASLVAEKTYSGDDTLYTAYSAKLKAKLGKSGPSLLAKARTVARQCSWHRVQQWHELGASFDMLYSVASVKEVSSNNGFEAWVTWRLLASATKERWTEAKELMAISGYFPPSRLAEMVDARAKMLETARRKMKEGEVERALLEPEPRKLDKGAIISSLAEQYSTGSLTDEEFRNKVIELTNLP